MRSHARVYEISWIPSARGINGVLLQLVNIDMRRPTALKPTHTWPGVLQVSYGYLAKNECLRDLESIAPKGGGNALKTGENIVIPLLAAKSIILSSLVCHGCPTQTLSCNFSRNKMFFYQFRGNICGDIRRYFSHNNAGSRAHLIIPLCFFDDRFEDANREKQIPSSFTSYNRL